MNIGSIRITQTLGRIGIRQYPAKMNIEQPPPRADMRQPRADLKITTEHGKIYIDQSQCFSEVGLKTALELAHDFYDESLMVGLDAIGEMSEQGDRLMRIEEGKDAIADIAVEAMHRDEMELNIDIAPKSRPNIHVKEGRVDIDVIPMSAEIDWQVHTKANINATRHKVDIYMDIWPDIKFEYVGKNVDREI